MTEPAEGWSVANAIQKLREMFGQEENRSVSFKYATGIIAVAVVAAAVYYGYQVSQSDIDWINNNTIPSCIFSNSTASTFLDETISKLTGSETLTKVSDTYYMPFWSLFNTTSDSDTCPLLNRDEVNETMNHTLRDLGPLLDSVMQANFGNYSEIGN